MTESDSFLFPHKEVEEILKTCCHGDHLVTLDLPWSEGQIKKAKKKNKDPYPVSADRNPVSSFLLI